MSHENEVAASTPLSTPTSVSFSSSGASPVIADDWKATTPAGDTRIPIAGRPPTLVGIPSTEFSITPSATPTPSPKEYLKEFLLEVSTKVVSTILITVLGGTWLYFVAEGWFLRTNEITGVATAAMGETRTLNVTSNTADVTGKVGRYFSRRRTSFQVAVVVIDPDNIAYVQDGIGHIAEDGQWRIEKAVFRERGVRYGLFAVVVKSHAEFARSVATHRRLEEALNLSRGTSPRYTVIRWSP